MTRGRTLGSDLASAGEHSARSGVDEAPVVVAPFAGCVFGGDPLGAPNRTTASPARACTCDFDTESSFDTVDEAYIWFAVRSVEGDAFEYTLGLEPTWRRPLPSGGAGPRRDQLTVGTPVVVSPAVRTSMKRVSRVFFAGAVLALPLAACAAVGGGGDLESDCDSDVSGSELTPVATAVYNTEGGSCNNNAFVDTDLDAFAYPASDSKDLVTVQCGEGDSTYRLFDVTDGTPALVRAGDCDLSVDPELNSPGTRYVLVLDHPASSEGANFQVSTVNE